MTPPQQTLSSCIHCESTCGIPYGHCHCGCGSPTSVSSFSHKAAGYIRGTYKKFARGHSIRVPPAIELAAPFKIDGIYCRLIPLSQGQYAIVDETDYEWLMQWKWFAYREKNGFYANRNCRGEDGKKYVLAMHRVILGMEKGDGRNGDHFNTVTLDNRRDNLRDASKSQNGMNRDAPANNSSGIKDLYFHRANRMWVARIVAEGKTIFLGSRRIKEEAAALLPEGIKKHHGEFARL
jgi:hypothetical protein